MGNIAKEECNHAHQGSGGFGNLYPLLAAKMMRRCTRTNSGVLVEAGLNKSPTSEDFMPLE